MTEAPSLARREERSENRRPGRWLTFGAKPTRHAGVQAGRVIALAFALGMALPVLTAFAALFAPESMADGTRDDSGLWTGYVLLVVLALTAAILGMRTAPLAPLGVTVTDLGLRRRPGLSGRRAWAATAAYVAVLAASIWVTVTLADVFGVHGSGVSAVTGRSPSELFHVSVSGVTEEPVLLALPMALAARVRWPWWTVYLLLAGLRISFHVYYGWLALFVVPWTASALLLWRWCPLLWPFVLGHGLFDLLQYLQGAGDPRVSTTASAVSIGLYVVGGLVLTVATMRWGWTWPGRRARNFRGNDSRGADVLGSPRAWQRGRRRHAPHVVPLALRRVVVRLRRE